MAEHTLGELHQMQALSLNSKIAMTITRVKGWLNAFDDECYISFSGGKDSTVLVDIIHNKMGRSDIPLVYVDTGLEYPEIREFVKGYGDKVIWLKPKMSFKQVVSQYGYPFFSKETAEAIFYARKYLKTLKEKSVDDEKQVVGYNNIADLLGIDRRIDKNNKDFINIKYGKLTQNELFDMPIRARQVLGVKGNYTNMYNKTKYRFMLDAPFEVHNACCSVMKKAPVHKFSKESNKKPITAQMASESRLRTQNWLQNGCNGFDMKSPISNPMAFWTEQDVLMYIKKNNLPICSVYGDIVEDNYDGQLSFNDIEEWSNMGIFDAKNPTLKTTGCERTGCMFCGFGCHLEKSPNRFEKMKITHPKQYEYIMKSWEDGGLNFKEVIDWINANGNMNIKY